VIGSRVRVWVLGLRVGCGNIGRGCWEEGWREGRTRRRGEGGREGRREGETVRAHAQHGILAHVFRAVNRNTRETEQRGTGGIGRGRPPDGGPQSGEGASRHARSDSEGEAGGAGHRPAVRDPGEPASVADAQGTEDPLPSGALTPSETEQSRVDADLEASVLDALTDAVLTGLFAPLSPFFRMKSVN
jgi:hypothetical protein